MIFDAYYSEFTDTQRLRGIELPMAWSGAQFQDGTATVENGLVTSGLYGDGTSTNGVMAQVRNDVNKREADLLSLGLNTEYTLNDNWRLELDISYSKAERQDWGLESYSGTGRGNAHGASDDMSYVIGGTGGAYFNPNLDYSDYDLIRLGGALNWGNDVVNSDGQDGFINMPDTEDELTAIRISAERYIESDFITSVEFGVEYKEREKSKRDVGYYLRLKNYQEGVDNLMPVPEEYRLGLTNLGFIGMGQMISYDSFSLFNDGAYDLFEQVQTDRATNTWTVNEDVTTAFAMANFDTTLFAAEMPFSGNFGVQVVYTDQYSHGIAADSSDGELVLRTNTGGTDYTEVLPSFNGTLEVDDNMFVRLGAARTLARARLDQMNASRGYSYNNALEDSTDINNSPWSGNGGNPELEPWMAWQFDLSLEYYFDELGYVAVAGFYKDLENYIYNKSVVQDFSNAPLAEGQDPALDVGLVDSFANGEGGEIHGIEATASISGELLHDSLEGFGLIVSGSITDSEVVGEKGSDPIDLPGLSKKVLNTTLYYENSGFEARVSSRYRSDFLGEISGLSMSRQTVNVNGELVVDAQLAYHFDENNYAPLDGLSLLFQVTNLTDEPFSTYHNGDARQVKDYQVYGRNFMAGFNYKF
jgi:iron complex outermembrane receptor protein